MSILDYHLTGQHTYHTCGGTVLVGYLGDMEQRYCDRCLAFTYDMDADLPSGTDKAQNVAASDAAEYSSPEGEC